MITGTTFENNNEAGVYLWNSTLNMFYGCIFNTNSIGGKLINLSNNNKFSSCTFDNTDSDIDINASTGVTIQDAVITSSNLGVNITDSANVTLENSTFNNAGGTGNVQVNLTGNTNVESINTTFEKSKLRFNDENSNITVKWYLHVLVKSGAPVQGATVKI